MMKMLEAGGIPPLSDGIRSADEDNPEGYYEYERVKQLANGDNSWLPQARGKSVKVIAALLQHLPPEHTYKVVFMRRRMEEILRSQKQMLVRRGEATDKVDDEELAVLFKKHLDQVTRWLAEQPHMLVCYMSYNDVRKEPFAQAKRINNFFDGALNTGKMADVINPDLYRQRRQNQ